ncbi:MAG TPA: hypothetical protein VL283_02430 [Candidatus Baltobacteraceae bacterium]|nr:hypothetical protein [Candidatus Baltobacteraceae bacterium]
MARQFRFLLDRRGLMIAPSAHDERYTFALEEGLIALDRHPRNVRAAVAIAKKLYGEGYGEHGELVRLYARREELECPDPEQRVIPWVPYSADGPGLNPHKWIRLDVWLEDQFLLEDAIAKMDEGVPI